MKKISSVTLILVLLLCVVCISQALEALPVYIFGYNGAASMFPSIAALREEVANIDLDDDEDKKLIKLLDDTVKSLEKKCNLFEEGNDLEPVEITTEYNSLLKISKELKLGREHILMTNISELLDKIETENKDILHEGEEEKVPQEEEMH